jgi:hypothetical protein
MLFHFSEFPSIEAFVPHVPRSNPTQAPAVWAIDEDHQSLYWFPRDCPRVAAWSRNPAEQSNLQRSFGTTATRVHAMESTWLDAMRSTVLYRYSLPAASFERWPEASGQWISKVVVEPVDVLPIGDLLVRHATARIDLRIVSDLWPLHDLAMSSLWDFSTVRMSNAAPRRAGAIPPP